MGRSRNDFNEVVPSTSFQAIIINEEKLVIYWSHFTVFYLQNELNGTINVTVNKGGWVTLSKLSRRAKERDVCILFDQPKTKL
jgi:hypothetical protein